ncbi:DNA polymerase IV [Neptunomonas japonica]|uniref:DNA polymerase IV n=1 Tax=Neptunomonas japonica TaxID=417574 RepID=UPI0003F80F4A|nr:DNA polymerase IV [Neptunomonas japonica]
MRKIIHCDCDCFFAAVEMRDNPEYIDIPLAIGGRADRRGVIATCNYPARAYGVRSAMATAHAFKLCPTLTVIPGQMEKYRKVSAQIMAIYRDVSSCIEPLSLDEAYLDVTDSEEYQGSATRIAQMLRERVFEETGITISAGVAPNKFLAKIASDWNKPNGLFVITPNQVDSFVQTLPVGKLFGVGRKTAEKLESIHVQTCGDLRELSIVQLTENFGRFGQRLYELSRGIDEREIITDRVRKSISVEHTFASDLLSLNECLSHIPALSDELLQRFGKLQQQRSMQGLFVKLKFNDFSQTTIEHRSLIHNEELWSALMSQGYQRVNKPVRLLGVGFRLKGQEAESLQQLDFWS